jgi:hypothetical protein
LKTVSTYDLAPGINAAYEVAVERSHFSASLGSGPASSIDFVKDLNCCFVVEAALTIDFAPEK